MKTLSKELKEHLLLRIKVAEKFGIQPISYRASRLLDAHCKSVEEAKEWASGKAILKVKQIGPKSVREIRCAFGIGCAFPSEKNWRKHEALFIQSVVSE